MKSLDQSLREVWHIVDLHPDIWPNLDDLGKGFDQATKVF